MNSDTLLSQPLMALNRSAGNTLVEQLEQQFRQRIAEQHWRAGMRLPSVRELARQVGVSRHTVVETYDVWLQPGWWKAGVVRAFLWPCLGAPCAAAHGGQNLVPSANWISTG